MSELRKLGLPRGLYDEMYLDVNGIRIGDSLHVVELGALKLYIHVDRIVKPDAVYNAEDPTVIDFIAYAMRRPGILRLLAKLVGVHVDVHNTSDPCSSQWSQYLVDEKGDAIEFREKIIIHEYERRKRLYAGSEKYRYRLYFASDAKKRWYLVYEEENIGWTARVDWHNRDVWIVPLQPMKLRVFERGVKVRCGPDGDAREYGPEIVEERVFPPEMFGL